jgi:outer membrane protein OmpA-like peptidoglycan-associated protein
MSTKTFSLLTALAAGCLAASCARHPNAALEQARAAYRDAAQTPEVARNAPVALHEAQQALDRADRAWARDRDGDEVEHLAYVAEKRVDIARARAQEKAADAQFRRTAEDRDEVLLGARTAEAESARQRASRLEQELAALRAKETERGTVITLGDVLFEFDKADLKPGAVQDLSRLATVLRDHPERQVSIEGHTDDVGTDSYNRELSEARAESVRSFLVRHGVAPNRIVARGYGEDYPVASNDSDAGRLQNRRVEVVILPEGKTAALR